MSRLPENHTDPGLSPWKVLVVDDEPTLRLGFAYALSNRDTIVDTAGTGREAIEKLGAGPFDIVILDLRMPDLDGMAVIESLRGREEEIPIVLCSAAISPEVVCKAVGYGVVDFLQKPVRPADLREVVKFVLGTKAEPLPLAMEAARHGRYGEAVAHLEEASPRKEVAIWRNIFEAMPSPDDGGGPPGLLEIVRNNLDTLSFHAS